MKSWVMVLPGVKSYGGISTRYVKSRERKIQIAARRKRIDGIGRIFKF